MLVTSTQSSKLINGSLSINILKKGLEIVWTTVQ